MMGPVETALRKATKLVTENWWQSGKHGLPTGHCPVTAISSVTGLGGWVQRDCMREVAQVIVGYRAEDEDSVCSIITDWNDHPDRGQSEVVAVMERACSFAASRGA